MGVVATGFVVSGCPLRLDAEDFEVFGGALTGGARLSCGVGPALSEGAGAESVLLTSSQPHAKQAVAIVSVVRAWRYMWHFAAATWGVIAHWIVEVYVFGREPGIERLARSVLSQRVGGLHVHYFTRDLSKPAAKDCSTAAS